MYITKVLETSIDIKNVYDNNISATIKKILEQRYNKKCFQGIYIVKILDIIRRSRIKLSVDRLDGYGTMNVQFRVEGIILVKHNVVHGCKITEIFPKMLTAESDYIASKIRKDNTITKILSVGQIVPLVIEQVRYIPNSTKISVISNVYVPKPIPLVMYRNRNRLSPTQVDKLHILIEQINEEEQSHTKFHKDKRYTFFTDITYPYRTKMDFSKSKITKKFTKKELNLENIMNIEENTYIIYPDCTKKLFFIGENTAIDYVEIDLFPLVANFFNQYLNYLYTIRGFMETYDTESIKKMVSYWKLCRKMKK